MITVVVVDELEILDGGLGDAAVKVEDVRLRLVVPDGRLVVQLQQTVADFAFPPVCARVGQKSLVVTRRSAGARDSFGALLTDDGVAFGQRTDLDALLFYGHGRDDERHLPRSFEAQNVRVLQRNGRQEAALNEPCCSPPPRPRPNKLLIGG